MLATADKVRAMRADVLEAVLKLSPEERLELIERLHESLEQRDGESLLTPEQEAELAKREERLERTGPIGEEWHVVKQRLLEKRGS